MSQALPDLNHAYEQLKDVLTAGLRRQVLLGVCASGQQAASVNSRLKLDTQHQGTNLLPVVWPNQQPQLLQAIADLWVEHPQQFESATPPTLVLPQVIALTQAPAGVQQRFLRQLHSLVAHIPDWNFNLLLWVNAPWLAQLQQAAPEFWRWHTGVFWFSALPETTLPASNAELEAGAADGTVLPTAQDRPAQGDRAKDNLAKGVRLNGRWTDPIDALTAAPNGVVSETNAATAVAPSAAPLANASNLPAALKQYRSRLTQGDSSLTTLNQAIYTAQGMIQQGREVTPEHWNDLGNFYWLRSRHPERAHQPIPDLLQALQHYEQALSQIGDPQAAPQLYAMVQNNLGAAYSDLAQQDEPIANLQRAIQAYETSLQYRTAESEPSKYSATQNNLGTAYWYLSQHQDPAAHLEAAIAAYGQASQIAEQQANWASWAMLQNNLGTTHWQLVQHSQDLAHLEAAITAYQNSLKYRTVDAVPAAYAATQNNIAAAYWYLANQPEQTREQVKTALDATIAAYQDATEIAARLSRQAPPLFVSFDFLAAYHNLGVVHYQLATETRFDLPQTEQQQHLYAAVTAYSQALQYLNPDSEAFTATLMGLVQATKACYVLGGTSAQSKALQRVPSKLLSQLLAQLKT
ncbi:MAG: hypothetical protein AAGG51_09365 [Cyanobacteria bacterium P01_G01_bin.54]